MTITGPPNFPPREDSNYILTVTLSYQAPSSSSSPRAPRLPPITIKEHGSPISTAASLTGTYRLYPTSSPNDVPVKDNWFDFDLDDSPKAVTAGNGFSTIHPGESITREVTIVPACFETKPGTKYVLRMPDAYNRIQWWGVGVVDAFSGIEVRLTEWSSDGGLNCGMSNGVEVVTET